jgi:cyanophycinase
MVGAKIGGFFNHLTLCFFMQIPFCFESMLCIDSSQELPLGFAKVNHQIGQNLMAYLALQKIKNTIKRQLNVSLVLIFNLLITSGYAQIATEENERFDLLLAGGGLKTCSSMATKNCTINSFNKDSKSTILYQISQSNLQKFNDTEGFLNLTSSQKMQINKVISNIYAESPERIVTLNLLRDAFEKQKSLALYQSLSDAVYYALLDSLEYAQTTSKGQRKREVTALKFNENQASVAIYQHFVEQADQRKPTGQERPRIAVITASSRDPFEVADFYESVFTEAGADVMWIPLDSNYQQARALESLGQAGCKQLRQIRARNHSYYREEIYPERSALQTAFCLDPDKMLTALANVQGVFFNGGDQSLTLATLKLVNGLDTPELSLIRQQVQAGKLIVGGTSAGTAVQAGGVHGQKPVPMLTNGDSSVAMQRGAFGHPPPSQRCGNALQCVDGLLANDLTYLANGGSGLFSLGLLDTHFSERERETRLALFAAETKQRFAFGVDETTALLVGRGKLPDEMHFEVLGQNGVFIIDRQQGVYARDASKEDQIERVVVSGVSHYVTSGSHFSLLQDRLSFELTGGKLSKIRGLETLSEGEWRNQVRAQCGTNTKIEWQQFANYYTLTPNPNSQFNYNAQLKHCSYINLPFTIFR